MWSTRSATRAHVGAVNAPDEDTTARARIALLDGTADTLDMWLLRAHCRRHLGAANALDDTRSHVCLCGTAFAGTADVLDEHAMPLVLVG